MYSLPITISVVVIGTVQVSGTSIVAGMNAQSALASVVKADGCTQKANELSVPIVQRGAECQVRGDMWAQGNIAVLRVSHGYFPHFPPSPSNINLEFLFFCHFKCCLLHSCS